MRRTELVRWQVCRVVALAGLSLAMQPVVVARASTIATTAPSSCTIGTGFVRIAPVGLRTTTCTWQVTNVGTDPITLSFESLPWNSSQDLINHRSGSSVVTDENGAAYDGSQIPPNGVVFVSQVFSWGPTLSNHHVDVGWNIYVDGSTSPTETFQLDLFHNAACVSSC